MRTIAPIKVSGIHKTDEDVRRHHADIEKRLEEMGRERVGIAMVTGGMPTEWNPIVHAWLAGDKLEPQSDK